MELFSTTVLSAFIFSSVPILLHFLYKKKVLRLEFSSLKFLKELNISQLKRVSWLEYLVLFLRVLTICFIVLSFMNPVSRWSVPFSEPVQTAHFFVCEQSEYGNLKGDTDLIKFQMIDHVKKVLNELEETDPFYLYDAKNSRYINVGYHELIEKISKLDFQPRSANFALLEKERREDMIKKRSFDNVQIYYFKEEPLEKLPEVQAFKLTEKADFDQRFIETFKFKQHIFLENERVQIILSFKHIKGNETVRVVVDNKLITQDVVDSAEVQLNLGKYLVGHHSGWVELDAKDDYREDNRFYFNFTVAESKKVLVLYDTENSYLFAFFKNFPKGKAEVSLVPEQQLLAQDLTGFDIIFYEGRIPDAQGVQAIESALKRKTPVVYIPTEPFQPSKWNQIALSSNLKLNTRFHSDDGKFSKETLPFEALRTSGVPLSLSFGQELNGNISFFTYFEPTETSGLTVIGNDRFKLLLKDDARPLYLFTSPFRRKDSEFMTSELFPSVLYGLTNLSEERVSYQVDKNVLTLYERTPEKELVLTNKQNKTTSLFQKKRNNSVQTDYYSTEWLKPGNYQIEHSKLSVLSVNSPPLETEHLGLENKVSVDDWTPYKNSQVYLWRFFLVLALGCYILELWLGKATIKF